MAQSTVVIGCRHPCGIILDILKGSEIVKVRLNGQNSTQARSPIVLLSEDDYGVTDVDADFWAEWKKTHATFDPLVTGTIFEAKSQNDAKAIHRELKAEKTGHEPMPQKAKGIKSTDEKED